MKSERWVDCNLDTCPNCGDDLIMFTSLTDKEISDNKYKDSDIVKCASYCGIELQISADEDGAWISSNN